MNGGLQGGTSKLTERKENDRRVDVRGEVVKQVKKEREPALARKATNRKRKGEGEDERGRRGV